MIKIIILMSIKVTIIAMKITITVTMKIRIVLKLMKIIAESQNPKMLKKKTSYRPTLSHQVQRSMDTKNKDLNTLSSILRPKGAIVFRVIFQ